MRIFSRSLIKEYCCRDLRGRAQAEDDIDDRQKRVPGFSQEAENKARVGLVGAGGLGGPMALGAVKKGIGSVVAYDGDDVAWSNLNRQLFTPRDVGRNKVVCLARNVRRMGFMGTRITAVPLYFQAAVERDLVQPCDMVVCAVDNDETRVFVSQYYLDKPVIFAAVSRDAGHGYVAVQQPGGACFGCMRPEAVNPETAVSRGDGACPVVPAVYDILSVVAGLVLYALDSVIMHRPRAWNFKQVVLHGLFPELSAVIERRPGCPICSKPLSLQRPEQLWLSDSTH